MEYVLRHMDDIYDMIWYDIDIDMIYINIYIEIYKIIEMARRKIEWNEWN